MDYEALFHALHPGFFARPYIRVLPPEDVFEEQVLPLRAFSADALPIAVPEGIRFGLYEGGLQELRETVRLADPGWPDYFRADTPVFGAFDDGRLVSFCILEDMGTHAGLRIGGPGCVGTVPAWRRRGIGLRMVQLATERLQQAGYDLSWIHYTHVGHWYARLGYRTVARWNSGGLVWVLNEGS